MSDEELKVQDAIVNGLIDHYKAVINQYKTEIEQLKSMSSVNPQQKIGYWIEDEYEMEVRCSACGEENDECSKYCPNCGTKMQEIEE